MEISRQRSLTNLAKTPKASILNASLTILPYKSELLNVTTHSITKSPIGYVAIIAAKAQHLRLMMINDALNGGTGIVHGVSFEH